jgi:hypothetical protein
VRQRRLHQDRNDAAARHHWHGDSLVELVDRHCPEIYDIAAEAGFRFVPNTNPEFLEQQPPQVWFDVVRQHWRKH